jgi:hypothetical protein
LDYVVLKPDLDVCQARAANRPEGKIEDYAPYHDFYPLFDAYPRHVSSDDNVDARSMAARIKEELDMGVFRVSGDGLPPQE